MRVNNAVVVVTGATSGIGRATAQAFASRGAALVLAGRRAGPLAELAEECQRAGGPALSVPADMTDQKAVEALARQAVARFGRLDVWVNNAAVTMFGRAPDTPVEDVRRVLDTNVVGYVNGSRVALQQMRQQGTGVLVNVSSVAGVVAQPYTSAYSMSKAAIRALSVSLRSELVLDGHRGIRVCSVLPATIDTPIFGHAANYTGREVVPMPPVYSAERVARAICRVARMPRREVVVGPMGRMLLWQHRLAPGLTERLFAAQVDKRHLSRVRPAPETSGNLYEPADVRDALVSGGWGGRRRTAQRTAVWGGLALAGGLAARRALRRG